MSTTLGIARWIRTIISAFAALFLAGCVASYNVSNEEPFRNYVGQTVPLQCPALVVYSQNTWSTKSDGVPSVLYARYGLINVDATNLGFGPILGKLPAGHYVTIDSVRNEAWFESEQITAYGHTVIPPSTKQVSFAYPWGIYPHDVMRAPWEPEGTPSIRNLAK
jgi:hypothetical protein